MRAAQYSVRDMESILKMNGFCFVRQKSSHKIWKNGERTISVPVVTLKPVIAQKIIKDNLLVTRFDS